MPHDNGGGSQKKDGSYLNNVDQEESRLDKTVRNFVQTTYASGFGNSGFTGSNNASDSIETLLQSSSNGTQDASKLIEKSSIDDNTHIRETSTWTRGFQKTGSAPNVNDLIGSGHLRDGRNEFFSGNGQGNSATQVYNLFDFFPSSLYNDSYGQNNKKVNESVP